MAIRSVVNVAANTGGGNQNIALNLGGLTPKFVMFVVSYATALSATPTNNATLSKGWTDGTRQAAIGLSAENAVGKTDTASSNVTSACIYCMAPNNGTADGVASFVSWTANQVTINWDTAPGAAFRIQVTAFAGSDFSAYVGSDSSAQTVDVAIDITAPAFEPSCVLMMTEGGTLNTTNNSTYLVSFGFANNDGGGAVSQCSHSIRNPDNSSITTPSGHTSSLYAAATIASTGAVVTGYEVGSPDASGFSVTPRVAAGSFFMYAALKFDNQATWVGILDSPTTTGNQSVTAPGFKPMARMQLINASTAVDTGDTTNATALYISVVGDDEFTTGISDEDALVGTTDTQSVAVNQAIHLDDDAGTNLKDATFVSWDANGWTDNYSLANGGVRKWPTLAIEEVSSGTTYNRTLNNVVTVADQQDRVDMFARTITDAADITDVQGRQRFLFMLLTSSLTVADVQGKSAAFMRLITDEAAATEAISRTLLAWRNVSDTLDTADTLSRVVQALRLLVSTSETTDELKRLKERIVFLLNGVSIEDQTAALRIVIRGVLDALSVTESISAERQWFRNLTSALSVLDSVARAIAGGAAVFERSLVDEVGTTDTVSRLFSLVRALVDHSDTYDALVRSAAYTVLNLDAASVADSESVARIVLFALVDNVGSSDFSNRSRLRMREVSDALSLSDEAKLVHSLVRRLVSQINVEDAVSRSIGVVVARFLSDSLTLDDLASRIANVVRVAASGVSAVDGARVTKDVIRALEESVDVYDNMIAGAPLVVAITLIDAVTQIGSTALKARLRDKLLSDSITSFYAVLLHQNIIPNADFVSDIDFWNPTGTNFVQSWDSGEGGRMKQELTGPPSFTDRSAQILATPPENLNKLWVADFTISPDSQTVPARFLFSDVTPGATLIGYTPPSVGRHRVATTVPNVGAALSILICISVFGDTRNPGDYCYWNTAYVYPKEEGYLYDSALLVRESTRQGLNPIDATDDVLRSILIVRNFANQLGISDMVLRDIYSFGAVIGLIVSAVRAEGVELTAEHRSVLLKVIKSITSVDVGGPL